MRPMRDAECGVARGVEVVKIASAGGVKMAAFAAFGRNYGLWLAFCRLVKAVS
jgi:hypothetical protein